MAKYPPLYNQSLSYPAQLDRQLLAALWPSGGASGGAVTAVANTMQVSIAPGSAAVPLQPGQGSALCHWDGAELVTVDPAPPTGTDRYDLIICEVRDNVIDGGPNNDFQFRVVTGTPGGTPWQMPPTPPNALAMAALGLPGGDPNLNRVTIRDLRSQGLAVPLWSDLATQGGTLVQGTGASGNLDNLPFTRAFPNACDSVVICTADVGPLYAGVNQFQITRTGFGCYIYRPDGSPAVGSTVRINWIATGH